MAFGGKKHSTETPVLISLLKIVITTDVLIVYKDIGNGTLARKSLDFLLYQIAIRLDVNLMDDHILDFFERVNKLLCGSAVWTIRLAPDDDLV